MKNGANKIKNKWFLIAAICYYVSSIALFFSKDNNSMTVTNLCLGSCFLCLSMADTEKDMKDNKYKKDKEDKK